jgi:hypothetical protein
VLGHLQVISYLQLTIVKRKHMGTTRWKRKSENELPKGIRHSMQIKFSLKVN